MKMQLTAILSLLLLIGCSSPAKKTSDQRVVSKLEELAESQDYFRLRKEFNLRNEELSPVDSIYFGAILSNVFNKPEASNEAVQILLVGEDTQLNDSVKNKLYRIKLRNHINLYEYKEAAATSAYIQDYFLSLTDSSDQEMLRNELKIWKALAGKPRQQIFRESDCTIPMYRDKVGLFNIDVQFGDSTLNFLFDTGANFSVILRSLVQKLGMRYIEADFYVTAATGLKVKSGLAVADELKIGDITCRNVVFLVLDDADLSFPQIAYYPNGAIGFPVIEAFDEIRISTDNTIFVPKEPVEYAFNNFALDGLMPILACEYRGDTLRFHFDTGATTTSLYHLFHEEYRDEIDSNYEKETLRSGSGGGVVAFEGYTIPRMQLKVADSRADLADVKLHIEPIGGEESNFHGNFGQDYIKQFDEMIISFKHASVTFN